MSPYWGSHIGRSFGDARWIEEACPCPKEPCGLVDTNKAVPECGHHPFAAYKTIRQAHAPENCVPLEAPDTEKSTH